MQGDTIWGTRLKLMPWISVGNRLMKPSGTAMKRESSWIRPWSSSWGAIQGVPEGADAGKHLCNCLTKWLHNLQAAGRLGHSSHCSLHMQMVTFQKTITAPFATLQHTNGNRPAPFATLQHTNGNRPDQIYFNPPHPLQILIADTCDNAITSVLRFQSTRRSTAACAVAVVARPAMPLAMTGLDVMSARPLLPALKKAD